MKNLRYDNEQCQSVAYEKASPELLRNKCGDMPGEAVPRRKGMRR